jgi:flagellar protein FlaG
MDSEISKVTAVSFTPFPRDSNSTVKTKVDELDAENIEKKSSESRVTSLDEAKKLVDEGNKILENVQRNLQFKVDDSTNQVVMSIIDSKSGEVIRQLPTEEALALALRLQESEGNSGAIIQDKA